MAEAPILVLGATGGQGGAVADALLARGARVRAMVRRPAEPKARRLAERGVEVLAGSLGDRSALGAAMRGVLGVCPDDSVRGGVDAEVAQGRAIVAAATTRGFPTWCSARSRGRTNTPGCRTSTARPSSKRIWPQAVCPTRSPPRPTSSTTRWAARDRIRPGYSICRCRRTGRCSSWPARTSVRSSPRCCATRTLRSAANRAGQRRRHAGADGRGAQRGGGSTGAPRRNTT